MGNTVMFESREAKLNSGIEAQVGEMRGVAPLKLPAPDAEICALFVKKIEGTYDVGRAKRDTDNAIDLLYIAYNTTPQQEGDIRVRINAIMDALIKAQQQSELAMRKAIGVADNVSGLVRRTFPDWLDVRNVKGFEDKAGIEEVKDFVAKDMLELATRIKEKALGVKKELDSIATTYEAIIKDTSAATASSEKALANRLTDKAAVEKEINETNARREQLDALVKDLQLEVAKYEKLARDYEGRANTAEERAFIMSIVQVGAQMLSAALPAIVTALTAAATGGTSVIAAAAANTVNRAVGDKNGDAKSDTDTDADAKKIATQKEMATKKAEAALAEKKVDEIKSELTTLNKELKTAEAKDSAATPAAADKPKETGKEEKEKETVTEPKDKDKDKTPAGSGKEDSGAVKELKSRIDAKQDELKTAQDKHAALIGVLSGMQASLVALDKGLGKMSEKQENTAASLREMQMKMLDKVETYEKERRSQNSELVKVSALLKGKQSEQETIQLAIRSLGLSLSALKRMKEIIEEIAFFFKSFADFMDRVSQEALQNIELFDEAGKKPKLRESYFSNLVESTDGFFLRQQAEWHAISSVSDQFCRSFADGWSKLNKLQGKYITGNELEAYFKTASAKLDEIVEEREAASRQKVIDLDGYRDQLRKNAMG